MEGSPKQLVEHFFSEEPLEPNSIQLTSSDENDNDPTYVFQLLANILLEALQYCTQDLTKINLDEFNVSYIDALNPWFKSMGFIVTTKEYHKSDEEYKQYYCRAVIRTPDYETFFIMKNIKNTYQFLLNGNFNHDHKTLPELMLVFYGNDNKVYAINFNVNY